MWPWSSIFPQRHRCLRQPRLPRVRLPGITAPAKKRKEACRNRIRLPSGQVWRCCTAKGGKHSFLVEQKAGERVGRLGGGGRVAIQSIDVDVGAFFLFLGDTLKWLGWSLKSNQPHKKQKQQIPLSSSSQVTAAIAPTCDH